MSDIPLSGAQADAKIFTHDVITHYVSRFTEVVGVYSQMVNLFRSPRNLAIVFNSIAQATSAEQCHLSYIFAIFVTLFCYGNCF